LHNTAADLLIAAIEARAALYGSREVIGDIGNISHAITLLDKSIAEAGGEHATTTPQKGAR
jgi:hypothetical protein